MTETLRDLAIARDLLGHQAGLVQESEARLQETAEFLFLEADKRRKALAAERVAQLTARVREEALATFAETGATKPWPGVQIKQYTKVEFDEAEVLAWCRKWSPSLLVLDTRAFKKIAQHLTGPPGTGAPITITQEYRATLARDLTQYL